ncbi:MAG: hypothetical protein HZA32_21040 [Opitutae bacterium]|nr:hypothetical protein [Opitutae bacterium]
MNASLGPRREGGRRRPDGAEDCRRRDGDAHLTRSRAFTLIETLLAAALLGGLLLALNFFVFSMAEIWGAGAERRLFDQHVRAVTREVETMLRTAALPPLQTDTPIFGREVRLDDGRRMTLVSYELAEGSPRLPWKTAPLPDVVCGLAQQSNKGFVLYWQSRLEKDFDDAAPRAFILSPFGAELKYEYLEGDGNFWRVYDQLQRDNQGRWRMPQRLRLGFAHGTMKTETTVTLPPAPGALPHY